MPTHLKGPVAASRETWGGAGENLGIEAIAGDTDLITTFDDFDVPITNTNTDAENFMVRTGWTLDNRGSATDAEVGICDPRDSTLWNPSCLRVFAGTVADSGAHASMDRFTLTQTTGLPDGGPEHPHLSVPSTNVSTEVLDGTVWIFACRAGFRADLTTDGAGLWDGKAFIGWNRAVPTLGGPMVETDGTIEVPSQGPVVGFHIPEDGSVRGISRRIVATADTEGTNRVTLEPAGSVDGTVANGVATAGNTVWYDLALRMNITDMSDDDDNGSTEFYWRRVRATTDPPGTRLRGPAVFRGVWTKHSTPILNQTPNYTIPLVPTIEVMTGVTADRHCVVFLDWWAMGCSRFSRLDR